MHMAADSVHGSIESKIRNRDVLPFDVLCDLIEKSRRHPKAVRMCLDDFRQWSSIRSLFLMMKKVGVKIEQFSQVRFERGESSLSYKTSPDSEEKSIDFVLKKHVKVIEAGKHPLAEKVNGVRGVKPGKKDAILPKLVPFMPENRRIFWRDMPSGTNSVDLLKSVGY